MCAVTFVVFVFGQKFIKFIGAGALAMITRMMGLILATIGVQMTINGLGQALKVGS